MERSALEAMSRDGFVGIRLPFIGLPKLPDITTFEYRALFCRLADLDWRLAIAGGTGHTPQTAADLAGLIGLSIWSNRPDYVLLYGKLDDAEAAKVKIGRAHV